MLGIYTYDRVFISVFSQKKMLLLRCEINIMQNKLKGSNF